LNHKRREEPRATNALLEQGKRGVVEYQGKKKKKRRSRRKNMVNLKAQSPDRRRGEVVRASKKKRE